MALNAKLKQRLWMPKLKEDGVIECQNENTALDVKLKKDGGSERRTKDDMMTLNVELEPWLWTPNWEETVALNAKLKVITMTVKQKQRLWTPN